MKLHVADEIFSQRMALDRLRRADETMALEAVHDKHRPAYQALQQRCGQETHHNWNITGHTIGGEELLTCLWCSLRIRETQMEEHVRKDQTEDSVPIGRERVER